MQKIAQQESLSFPTKVPLNLFCKGFLTIPVDCRGGLFRYRYTVNPLVPSVRKLQKNLLGLLLCVLHKLPPPPPSAVRKKALPPQAVVHTHKNRHRKSPSLSPPPLGWRLRTCERERFFLQCRKTLTSKSGQAGRSPHIHVNRKNSKAKRKNQRFRRNYRWGGAECR